jgi:hydrogenase maturation protein HypF
LDLPRLLGATPQAEAHDLHPDYASTRVARESGLPCCAVQHHHAHIAACMADNGLDGEVLGLAWDGTGFGPDGTVWGGEFLACGYAGYRRVAHLRQFRLPGGDAAARDPRRSLLGCLHALRGGEVLQRYGGLKALAGFSAPERVLLVQMLDKGLNAPLTSSMGRLFDAAAALAGFERVMRHEGQAAMALEALLRQPARAKGYAFPLIEAAGLPLVADWGPCLEAMAAEAAQGLDPSLRAERFHSGLAGLAVAVAQKAGLSRVCLSGGCFQNRRLLQAVVEALERAGFRAYWHQRVPCNDGGISLGQAAVQAALAGEA